MAAASSCLGGLAHDGESVWTVVAEPTISAAGADDDDLADMQQGFDESDVVDNDDAPVAFAQTLSLKRGIHYILRTDVILMQNVVKNILLLCFVLCFVCCSTICCHVTTSHKKLFKKGVKIVQPNMYSRHEPSL